MNKKGKNILIFVVLSLAVGAVLVAKNLRYNKAVEAVKAEPLTNAEQPLPLLLELGSHNCMPCKTMMPILAELKKGYADKLKVRFIDVWEDKSQADKYQISVIPTQIFFDSSGAELFRHTGFFARDEIVAKWKELGYDLELEK